MKRLPQLTPHQLTEAGQVARLRGRAALLVIAIAAVGDRVRVAELAEITGLSRWSVRRGLAELKAISLAIEARRRP